MRKRTDHRDLGRIIREATCALADLHFHWVGMAVHEGEDEAADEALNRFLELSKELIAAAEVEIKTTEKNNDGTEGKER